MFDGITRRIVSIWFPRLASDRVLRSCPIEAPFALIIHQQNTNRIYCLNRAATQHGLHAGMSYADARAFCPELISRPADIYGDQRFLHVLRRWATRYCPWVGLEGRDGLTLDISGAAHLFGGEAALLSDMRQRFSRARVAVRLGMGDSRGAAWALSHYGEGIAEPNDPLNALGPLPVAALRLEKKTDDALQRLGLRRIADLEGAARAPLARRFGKELMLRLDQALGRQPEGVTPLSDPPHFAVRMSLPEPIGLEEDVMAGVERLLDPLCQKLKRQAMGARGLVLNLRRVDQGAQSVELRLAQPLHDAARILPLFKRGIAEVEAGFGIDQIRLHAVQVETLPPQQLTPLKTRHDDKIDDLITRIGTRIGLENIHRFLPADSHIPERSYIIAPAAYSKPSSAWVTLRPRPVTLFPPEALNCQGGGTPPTRFRWRRMQLSTARATGPERILPEWWLDDPAWHSGMRDYWRIETHQGWRLWMFFTPQNPDWFVHGAFA